MLVREWAKSIEHREIQVAANSRQIRLGTRHRITNKSVFG